MDSNETKEILFASDLLAHIGNQEIESVLPTASEYTRSLYDQVLLSHLNKCYIEYCILLDKRQRAEIG